MTGTTHRLGSPCASHGGCALIQIKIVRPENRMRVPTRQVRKGIGDPTCSDMQYGPPVNVIERTIKAARMPPKSSAKSLSIWRLGWQLNIDAAGGIYTRPGLPEGN